MNDRRKSRGSHAWKVTLAYILFIALMLLKLITGYEILKYLSILPAVYLVIRVLSLGNK